MTSRTFLFVLCLLAILQVDASLKGIRRNLTAFVDTRIGTGGGGWGIGELNPGAQVPFGCMRLGPDTSLGLEPLRIPFDTFAGYYWNNEYMECLSHTHVVGAGEGDFQNFGFIVVREWDNNIIQNSNYRSLYSHTQEIALPGYYAVELLTPNAYAEVAVSGTHSGMHRYTCRSQQPSPSPSPCVLVVDICHGFPTELFEIASACQEAQVYNLTTTDGGLTYEFSAWVHNRGMFSQSSDRNGIDIYFYGIITAQSVTSAGTSPVAMQQGMWRNYTIIPSNDFTSTTSESLGVSFQHPQVNGSVVFTVRAGLSFVSPQNAYGNLVAQQQKNGTWLTFEQSVQQTVDEWETLLSGVQVSGGVASSDWHMTSFYSALYHAHMPPTTYTEYNGEYMGEDWNVHTQTNGRYMSDLSIWDIYRTQQPLMGITRPDIARDVANSMMTMYQTTGLLPVWVFANVETDCMVGHHSAVILADHVQKGVGQINATAIFDAIVNGIGAQNSQQLDPYGYVTFDSNIRGCSLTQDYALDSGAVVNLANFLGNTSVVTEFSRYAKDYSNVWDNESTYFCPRYQNGSFWCPDPMNPYPFETHFTEGNGAEYRYYVPHDIPGMIALFPNASYFAQQLNEFFDLSYLWPLNTTLPNWTFWAGNEPDILTQVLFNWAGNEFAYLTQYWFPTLLDTYYTPYASGIPGNDDYGTMSSWAAFGYFGFYPVPPTDQYALFVPRFDSIDVSIQNSYMSASPWRNTVTPSTSGPTTIVQVRCYNRPASGTAYLANVSINGVPLQTPIMTQSQLLHTSNGAPSLLEFYLTSEQTVFGAMAPSQGGPEPFKPQKTVVPTGKLEETLQRLKGLDVKKALINEKFGKHRRTKQ